MPTTIRDVASAAGVSPSTVSRVFNNEQIVKPDTRGRIIEAAERLNYVPNATARSLSMQKTDSIGCVLPEPSREYFSEILRGVDEAARAASRHLLIACTHNDLDETREVLRSIRGRVDGLLLLSPVYDAAQIGLHRSADLPIVFLHARTDGTPYDAFAIDNEGGAHAATTHLIERDHRRIALVSGQSENRDTRERSAGYERALREAGIAVDPDWTFRGDYTQDSGWQAGLWLAGRIASAPHQAPTAAFAINDYMALGLMSALQQAGVRVPDQVAVVGFDDILSARYAQPGLTTVRVPAAEMSRQATERLLELTGSASATLGKSHLTLVSTHLVVRAST